MVPSFLPEEEAEEIFQKLLPAGDGELHGGEIHWNELSHLPTGSKFPRLTAYQSERNANGHLPAYRCADPQPWHGQYETDEWSPTIAKVKEMIEHKARHSFNWSRILNYRDGRDGMGFHSDKCLDLRHGSFIASLSLGETREYELKPKANVGPAFVAQKITLRHNTLLLLGPKTNQYFVHLVKKGGKDSPRISITFRDLATWYVHGHKTPQFYGQGTPFSNYDEFYHSRERHLLHGGLFVCAASAATTMLVGIRRSDSLTRRESLIPWIAGGLVGLVGTAVCAWLDWRGWVKRQQRLGQVYRWCNVLPITSFEARDLALYQDKVPSYHEDISNNSTGEAACARDG